MICNLIFNLIFTVGCGSSPVFNIKSEPQQADVYYVPNDESDKKIIGKTPLTIPMEELMANVKNVEPGEFFKLSIEKDGFVSQSYALPTTQFGISILELDVKLKSGKNEVQKMLAKEILDLLFLAQKFAIAQEFERAQIEIDKILKIFPDFSNAMSMRAAIYLAQKNYSESIKWYEKTISADPKNDEAVKMLAKIKSISSGERLPSSSTKPENGSTK